MGKSGVTENRFQDKVPHEVFSRVTDNYLHGVVNVEPSVLIAGDALLGVGPDEDVKSSLLFAKRDTITANLYLCEEWLCCVYGTRLAVTAEENYAGFSTKVRLVRIFDFYLTSPSLDLVDDMLYLCEKYGTETDI